ncbi:type IV pilin protein [bacterium SCSIO 12696]|nr:type IV pilin protein [bacterium SCSIO 12696]
MKCDLNKRSYSGFTLVEIIIVVAIVAILAAIALPAYQEQVRETRRSDGKGFLLEVAAAQERYFTQNVSYGTLAELGYAGNESPEGYYTIAYTALNAGQGFRLTATPRIDDPDCTTLTLDHTNMRQATGAAPDECWD